MEEPGVRLEAMLGVGAEAQPRSQKGRTKGHYQEEGVAQGVGLVAPEVVCPSSSEAPYGRGAGDGTLAGAAPPRPWP